MFKINNNFYNDAIRRFKRNKMSVIGLSIICIFIIIAISAPYIIPYSYDQMGFNIAEYPTKEHWLGTDGLGRDMFSRLIYGARISMSVGIICQALILIVGTVLGCISGYFGGKIDNLIMRFTDIMFAFPRLLFALLLMTVFGRSVFNLILALGLVGWPATARLVRGQVMSIKDSDFVVASDSLGASTMRIILKHILPNILGPLIVDTTFGIPRLIMSEAFLSFIGIGAPPPIPSWGLLISEGFRWIRVKPHLTIFPTITLSIVLLAFNFAGDGLRDALDPKMDMS